MILFRFVCFVFKDSSWQLRINSGELNDFFGWFFNVMWNMSKNG